MSYLHNSRLKLYALVFVIGGARMALAQPTLNPPPGPIQESGRFGTRTEVNHLPYMIGSPGSYYLSRDFNLAGTNGIEIRASNVTIDLNGFTLQGGTGPAVVRTSGDGITLRNGRITGWSGDGVHLAPAMHCVVENLVVTSNTGAGITVGDHCIVRGCIVESASNGSGIVTGESARVADCLSKNNDQAGIEVGSYSVVTGCVSRNNRMTGIQLQDGGIAEKCLSRSNESGFIGGSDCIVANCNASLNSGGDGINLGAGSVVRGCAARANAGNGIAVCVGLIDGNSGFGNGGDDIGGPVCNGTARYNNRPAP